MKLPTVFDGSRNGKSSAQKGLAKAWSLIKPRFAQDSAYAKERVPRRSYAPSPHLC